jgi:hypothetical protein
MCITCGAFNQFDADLVQVALPAHKLREMCEQAPVMRDLVRRMRLGFIRQSVERGRIVLAPGGQA